MSERPGDEEQLRAYLEAQDRMGRENTMAAFRQNMRLYAPRGEPLEQTCHRLARDPATAVIAARIGCTVAELLEGLGQTESFWRPDDYDEEEAKRLVDEAKRDAAAKPIGVNQGVLATDGMVVSLSHIGEHRAPHLEDAKGQVLGSQDDALLIKEQIRRIQFRPRPARRRRAK